MQAVPQTPLLRPPSPFGSIIKSGKQTKHLQSHQLQLQFASPGECVRIGDRSAGAADGELKT